MNTTAKGAIKIHRQMQCIYSTDTYLCLYAHLFEAFFFYAGHKNI